MLSQDRIKALFAEKDKRANKKQGLGKVCVLDDNGHGVWVTIEKMSDYNLGQYEGKVGSTRRSAKGRTVRMPNGSRRYIRSENVLAYKLR